MMNKATLTGTVSKKITFGKERLVISVKRNSSAVDIIEVWGKAVFDSEINVGDRVEVYGKLTTRKVGKDSLKEIVGIEATKIVKIESESKKGKNEISLEGVISYKDVLRETKDRVVMDLVLISNGCRIKVLAWNENAEDLYNHYEVGDRIYIDGRLQSREYKKTSPEGKVYDKLITELSITTFFGE